MKKTLITTVLALGLGLVATPTFAGDYFVNGHAASPAETQILVSYGAQPGRWVVNGYGIAPAIERAGAPATGSSSNKCRYVLDVLICD